MRKITAIIVLGWCGGAVALGVVQGVLAAASSPASSSSAPWWSGVREAVKANLSPDGTLSGTPTQDTTVIASGTGVVKVDVPVSSKPSNRGLGKHLHHPPVVSHGRVTFDFPTSGLASQDVSSNFDKQLPITVTPTYELNGQTVSPAQLSKSGSKGGVLLVKYKLTNVTKQTATVHFKGFKGTSETRTVSEPIPYVAKVKFTVPKGTTGLDAPGATLVPLVNSVQVSWDVLLAPPLSSATHTVSYSIRVNGTPQSPKAQVQLQAIAVQAKPPSAKSSGKSSGKSAGKSSGKSKSSKSPGRSKSSRSSARAKTSRSSGGAQREKPSRTRSSRTTTTQTRTTRAGGPILTIPTRQIGPASLRTSDGLVAIEPSVAIADAEANAQARLGQAQAAAQSELARIRGSLSGLLSTQNAAVANSSAASDTRSGSVTGASQGALSGLSSRLAAGQSRANDAVAAAVLVALAAVGDVDTLARRLVGRTVAHEARADALAAATSALKAQTANLVSLVSGKVDNAVTLAQSLTQAINDLGAFPDHTTPEWIKLSSDLQAAQAKAQAALSLGNDLTGPVSRLDSAAQQLQADAATLATEAHSIAASAGDVAGGLQTQVANAMDQLQSQVGLLKDQTKDIGAQIDAARVHIGDVAGAAKANFDAALEQVRAEIAAKAAAAKAAAQAAIASAQQKLAAAESDYAELLGAQQIGLANQLPDGNATGAITQYGYYVINISGTSS